MTLELCTHESGSIAAVATDSLLECGKLLPGPFLQALTSESGQPVIGADSLCLPSRDSGIVLALLEALKQA